MGRISKRLLLLIALETMLIVAAVLVAGYVRLGGWAWEVLIYENGIPKTLLVAVVTQACLYYLDLYDLRVVSDRRELFIRIAQALGAASFILAAIYFWFPALILGRGVFMIAAGFIVSLVLGWRVLFEWLGRRLGPRERLLLVGTSAAALALARELFDRRQELGVTIVGFVDPDPSRVGEPVLNPGVIGTIEDIPAIVRARNVDRVVVSLADARGKLPMDKLLEMRLDRGVAFDHLASVYEEYTGKIAVENLRPSWFIFSEGFRKTWPLRAAKRALDVALAAVGLVLLTPVMLFVAAAVRLTSAGPVLYHQRRVGLHGRLFTAHKFRSMRDDAEATTGAVWASANDSSRHQGRAVSAADATRRGPAALERPGRRDEPRRTSAGTAGVRGPTAGSHSLLRDSSWREARTDRLGPGAVHLRREPGRRPGKAAVRFVLPEAPDHRVRFVHSLLHDQDRHPPPGRPVSAPAKPAGVVNAMTIDVEDYFHVSVFDGLVPRDRWPHLESRVSDNTERLLRLFEEAGVTATFFVLGCVAERMPALVERIAAMGHEVASHGYAHRLIYDQAPAAFRDDVRRAKDILESAIGRQVDGFRAPSYSITPRTLWALDVLIEEGHRYDASIFPIRHDRYGIALSPRHPEGRSRDSG